MEEILGIEALATSINKGQVRQADAINEEAQATSADGSGQEVEETQEIIVPIDQEAIRTQGDKGTDGT